MTVDARRVYWLMRGHFPAVDATWHDWINVADRNGGRPEIMGAGNPIAIWPSVPT